VILKNPDTKHEIKMKASDFDALRRSVMIAQSKRDAKRFASKAETQEETEDEDEIVF
jgi:hypothetical protein